MEVTLEIVREELGNPPVDVLADDTIVRIIDQEDEHFYNVMSRCSRIISRYFALQAGKTLGPLSIDYQERAKTWKNIAEEYDKKAHLLAEPIVGALSESHKQKLRDDTDATQPAFRRGQFDILKGE